MTNSQPMWHAIEMLIVMASLTLILYFNASDFDATEVRSLLLTCFALLGVKGAGMALPRK